MKKIVGLAVVAATLYRVAVQNGIRSFKDVKEFVTNELKALTGDVKHELVS